MQEAAAHAALLDCAQSFSPRVEDAGATPSFWILPAWNRFSGRCQKLRAIWRAALAISASNRTVAVASNPDTAVLAAYGFSGVTVIPEGKEAEQLGSLPLEVLFEEETPIPARGNT